MPSLSADRASILSKQDGKAGEKSMTDHPVALAAFHEATAQNEIAEPALPPPALVPETIKTTDTRFGQVLAPFLTHKLVSFFAIAFVCATIMIGYVYFRGAGVLVVVARRGDLVETVVASGHVESRFRVDIASQMTGTVARVAVQEGDYVHKGQILVVLASEELASTAVQAGDVMAQAQAHMRQMRELSLPIALEARRSAAANFLGTQQIFDRTSILMKKGFVTRAMFDDAKKNLDVARAQLQSSDAQVSGAQAGGSDYATAQSQLDQARAGYAAASSRLAYTTILAPRDGVLISRNVEQGAVITPGQTLMILAPAGDVQLVLQIDERNLGKVVVGQPAIASSDAYPSEHFAAAVVFINPGIDIARASATVKLAVAKPPAHLRQDMTVSVDIETARRRAALVLPGSAIHDTLSAHPWVLVVRDGRAVRQNVTLGLQGNLQVQILTGIAVGDRAIPTTAAIVAGDRVRARTE